ncbi:hypothetical protein D3C81_1593700 [compost metagenome]
MGQRGSAHGRAQGRVGICRDLFDTVLCHPFANQLQAGDDAGQQVVEVMGDAASKTTQGIHLLQLQQLRLGLFALGRFPRQLGVGVLKARQVRALAVAMLGDVFDEHQAQPRRPVGR